MIAFPCQDLLVAEAKKKREPFGSRLRVGLIPDFPEGLAILFEAAHGHDRDTLDPITLASDRALERTSPLGSF